MEVLLIEKVRQAEELYNMSSPFYKDYEVRQKTWEKIGNDLQIEPEKAKREWEKLRRCFSNAINRRRKKFAKGGQEISSWKYAEQMSFLLPFMEHRMPLSKHSEIKHETTDNEDESENSNQSKTVTNTLYDIKKPKRSRKNQNATFDNTTIEENTFKKNGQDIETKPFRTLRVPYHYENMDETDWFFLSMARMTAKLPESEQTKIKLGLSNSVLKAEMENSSKEES